MDNGDSHYRRRNCGADCNKVAGTGTINRPDSDISRCFRMSL